MSIKIFILLSLAAYATCGGGDVSDDEGRQHDILSGVSYWFVDDSLVINDIKIHGIKKKDLNSIKWGKNVLKVNGEKQKMFNGIQGSGTILFGPDASVISSSITGNLNSSTVIGHNSGLTINSFNRGVIGDNMGNVVNVGNVGSNKPMNMGKINRNMDKEMRNMGRNISQDMSKFSIDMGKMGRNLGQEMSKMFMGMGNMNINMSNRGNFGSKEDSDDDYFKYKTNYKDKSQASKRQQKQTPIESRSPMPSPGCGNRQRYASGGSSYNNNINRMGTGKKTKKLKGKTSCCEASEKSSTSEDSDEEEDDDDDDDDLITIENMKQHKKKEKAFGKNNMTNKKHNLDKNILSTSGSNINWGSDSDDKEIATNAKSKNIKKSNKQFQGHNKNKQTPAHGSVVTMDGEIWSAKNLLEKKKRGEYVGHNNLVDDVYITEGIPSTSKSKKNGREDNENVTSRTKKKSDKKLSKHHKNKKDKHSNIYD